MMLLMASDSMARYGVRRDAKNVPRTSDDLRGHRRPFRPLRPFTEELGQLQRICDVFADESSVFNACENIKGNVETFQSYIENTINTFMNEETSHLEDVVISVCKAMNDDDFVAKGYEKVTNKHCKKLDIPRRGMFYD